MPAVYAIDLIAKRDRKRKMDSSIVKGWNVHYQTLEEVEQAARLKKQEQEESRQQAQENEEASADFADSVSEMEPNSEEPSGETGEDTAVAKDAYNHKTRSYSGHYGKKPIQDEEKKQQVHAILYEKPDAFSSALSALQSQDESDHQE